MTSAFSRLCLGLFLLLSSGISPLALGQGIHVKLRANANPFPAHHRYANVWGDGHYAYVGSYIAAGVLIFDISNPDSPVLVANYTDPGHDLTMEDVEVKNGIGYFASNYNGGIHIVDLSNPANPKLITRITSAMGGWDSVHTLLIDDDGDHLYVPHFLVDPYVQVWNVKNPAAPVLVQTFKTTDSNSIRAMSFLNNHLFTSGRGGHTDIWDVSNIDKKPPTLLGTINSGVLSHSSSPTADGHYLVCSRELHAMGGDVQIYDISNPAKPLLLSTITMPAFGINAVSPHNPMVMGNILYHSWYQAGMLAFDITDPSNPVMVGNYDTWPGPVNWGQYDGDWGVYPYLGQDKILVSDQDTGLYILDATGVSSDPVLFNYQVNPATVPGSWSATATAFLLGLAPSGGLAINVSTTGPVSTNPTITIPSGGHSASDSVNTSPVSSKTVGTLTASENGVQIPVNLTVLPPIPGKIVFFTNPITGGQKTQVRVVMQGPVAVNTNVALSVLQGSNAVASMPSQVVVSAGHNTVVFTLITSKVTTQTIVQVQATANGGSNKGSLTVNP
jgi:choice-of-anchor B domain-containing protein